MGNVGQATYGAPNAFLDGMMEQRARAGQTGVSVSMQWPAVSGVGMAAAAVSRDAMCLKDGWSLSQSEAEGVLRPALLGSCRGRRAW